MYDQIVLISIDTLRSDCINANSVQLWRQKYQLDFSLETATLDELAQNGAFFPNSITSAPYTSTSHATYFTGQWPLRHGLYEYFNRKLQSKTIFHYAKQLGFQTIFKTDFPIILGEFLGFTEAVDQYIIENDEEFLTSLDTKRPNFSFVHFGGVHSPYGFHNLYYGGQAYIDKVEELEREIGGVTEPLSSQLIETYRNEKDMELLFRYKKIVEHHYGHGRYDKLFNLYLEGINFFLKHRFNAFLEQLLQKLQGTRFLIVLFGDHGEEFDEVSLGHFNSVAEGIVRVPIIFYGTDVKPNTYWDRIRTVDVTPTLVELMNNERAKQLDFNGKSLAPTVLKGDSYPIRPAIAQTYVSNVNEFVNFQNRLLDTGKRTGSLNHILMQEVTYDADFKLHRQTHYFTIHGIEKYASPFVKLYKMDDAYRWHLDENKAAESRLLQQLDNYNAIHPNGLGQKVEASQEIRRQLQNMGYRV